MRKFLLAISLLCSVNLVQAQWNTDTLVRNIVCDAAGYQYEPQMCSDGHKGAFVVWADGRTSSQMLYAQHIDSTGKATWLTNGVQLSIPPNDFTPDYPLIVSDTSGGVIIFYNVVEGGGPDLIYAQHLNANGIEQWQVGAGGIPISTAQDSRIANHDASDNQTIAADGSGGAFITWQGYNPFDIYTQHIDKAGNIKWPKNGLQITNTDSAQTGYISFIVNSGRNTATVAYSYGTRLYMQRINEDGTFAWINAKLLTSMFAGFGQAYLAYDSISPKDNTIAVWQDTRGTDSTGIDLYMQRIDTLGNKLFSDSGVVLSNAVGDESFPYLLLDANGGFYSTYITSFKAMVQHTNADSTLLWQKNGIGVYNATTQANPVLTNDGAGGIISLWNDTRNFSGQSLYAQHYNYNGNALWRANGVPVIVGSVDMNHSANPIISFDKDTALTCFAKTSNRSDDIYIARFGGISGVLPLQIVSFTAVLNYNETNVKWVVANEVNTSAFEVQRATDAIHFTSLTTVKAKGNTAFSNSYFFTDVSPVSGINYYRLKEVDVNGVVTYSKIVSVTKSGNTVVMLYPNPAVDKVSLRIISSTLHTATFGIFDYAGRTLMQKEAQVGIGTTSISFTISSLSKGVYFIKSDDSTVRIKFEKK